MKIYTFDDADQLMTSPPYSSGGKGRMALFKGNNRKRGCAPRLFHRWDLMLEAGAGGFGTG
jgi:hypothetical protein